MSVDPIVAGTDGSSSAEAAVDKAAALARALGAAVHVVSAYSTDSSGAWMAATGGMPVAVDDSEGARRAATEIVARSRARLQGQGVEVRTHVCQGDPAEALMTIAGDEHAQMIVVGNRGMMGARRILGSVPNRVSHRARCGVLIVPTT